MSHHTCFIRSIGITFAIVFCTFTLAVSSAHAQTLKVYVSPTGNDHWSGLKSVPDTARADGPVATIARARDILRTSKFPRAAEVIIAGGAYLLSSSFELDKDDSGKLDAP